LHCISSRRQFGFRHYARFAENAPIHLNPWHPVWTDTFASFDSQTDVEVAASPKEEMVKEDS
jgi:hypothetical protein